MRPFQAALDTCLDSPFFASLSVHGLHFTVYAPSKEMQVHPAISNTVVSELITDRDFLWGELLSNYRYRIPLPEELIAITETDLWEFQKKIFHYRYRFSLDFQLISITDTDFGLETN